MIEIIIIIIIKNLKMNSFFEEKIIIHFANVETDP